MKTEIIIAVRGEKPENLRRTVAEVAQVAPVHVVFDGNETPILDDLKADTSMPWTEPRGCAQARRAGILDSDADLIVVIDGHMTFSKNWLKKIQKHIAAHPKDIVCLQTKGLDKNFNFTPEPPFTGAFISYKQKVNLCPGLDYYALKGQFNPPDTKTGEIGCLMGACYGFLKERYLEIGDPWKILDEWGGDEEILSLANWLCGGRIYCLPVIAGHIFSATRINRTDSPEHNYRRIASRFAILESLPIPDAERGELSAWLMQKSRPYPHIWSYITPDRHADCIALQRQIASFGISWQSLKDRKIVRPLNAEEEKEAMGFNRRPRPETINAPVKLETRKPMPLPKREPFEYPLPVSRPLILCERCDKSCWERAQGFQGYQRCRNCGHKQRVKR